MRLIVLMSTYNGEKYLREQLDSLLCQEYLPDKILIRDDGSSDSTLNILKEYADKNSIIDFYQGSNQKPAKSFFSLINEANDFDYYALCDQDDVWKKDKMKVAIEHLEKEDQSIPLLYCSRFTLTDENLNPKNSNISKLYSYTDFAHSLLYQTAPGCTFVFNKAAREKIIQYDLEKEYNIIHDSIIHKVVCLYGKMILDENSTMYYRQHSFNEIGLSANIIKVTLGRIQRVFSGKLKHSRRDVARSLLNVYGDSCSSEKKHLLEVVAEYENNSKYRKELLTNTVFKVKGINQFLFEILVLINYI